jgi:hypothetical protein
MYYAIIDESFMFEKTTFRKFVTNITSFEESKKKKNGFEEKRTK